MDAAQILMMPMASTATVTTLSPDPGAAQTSGELSALFSDLLAQTVVTQTATQQIPVLDSTMVHSLGSQDTTNLLNPVQGQDPAALLMQNEPSEPESSTALQMVAVYAQLSMLQTPPAPQVPQEIVSVVSLHVDDLPAAESLEAVSFAVGSGQSFAYDPRSLQQSQLPHNAVADAMQAPQLQEKELIGQTDSLYQKPVNTEESAGEPLDQETVASARQTENRQQPVVASNVESRVTEQQTLVQAVGGSRPPEQQPVVLSDIEGRGIEQKTLTQSIGGSRTPEQQPVVPINVERRATEQQQIVQLSDTRITEQQPVIQHVGSSRGQEHQQAAAQVQVVPNQGNQDASVSSKPQAMVQTFRFAQSNEVAVAAAEPGRHGRDFSGQQQSPLFEQSLVPIDSMSEKALIENTGFMTLASTPDEGQHLLVLQAGSRVQTAAVPLTNVDEQSRQIQSEQGVRQVFERLSTHEFKQGRDQISLKLSPEHLGNVQLNLRMEEQGLKLEIIAEQRGVREALLRQGDELKETLARQNIRIDSFEVSTGTLGGQTQQQQREWRQMNPEQRIYHAQYASAARGEVTAQDSSPSVLYFAPQYQSTLDVRF